MKTKIKKLKGTARELCIEVPKDKVQDTLSGIFDDIRKRAKLDGFREGKAPLDLIKKNYKSEADEELKRLLIPEAYQKALEEHKVDPVSYPEVSDIVMGADGGLVFTAKVDVYPEVDVKKYKGIKVNREKISVSDGEIDETIGYLRNVNASFDDTGNAIKKGDFAVCDVVMMFDGKAIAQKRKNMWIEADKDASMFGMGEELIGMQKNGRKHVKVSLPEKYPDAKYAGKEVVFDIEVKETKEKKLPELGDEFAGKLGKKTMQEVRDEIRDQIFQRKESENNNRMKNEIIASLLKANTFDVPESMVKRQLKVLLERAENDLLKKGVNEAAITGKREELAAKLHKEAENKVRVYFMLDFIANAENIKISPEEVDNSIRSLAESYNKEFDEVRKYYEEHNLMDGVKEELREEKTLELLLSEAEKADGKSK